VNNPSEARLVKRLSAFASTAAVCSVVIGLSVLVGWTLHVSFLLTWGAATTMAPNAAACSVLAGVSLWLLRTKNDQRVPRARNLAARTAATIVALVAVLSLAEPVFGLDLGIDRLLLVTAPALDIAGARIRMSPIAAIIFLLFGFALWLIDWRTSRDDWPAQFFSLGAAMGAAFGLFGLVLGPNVSPITLAFPAVVTYFLLAFGIVCARASWAIGGLLTRDTQGAGLLRRAVPAGLLVLSLIGWLISKPLLSESHFTWIEVGALAIACSVVLAAFITWIAIIVDRGDTERKKLEQALRVSQEQADPLLDRIEEPLAEAKLRTKVRAGFAVAIVLTCLLSFFSWRSAQQANIDADRVAHTHEVETALEATLRHLVDVETGSRGFALTGSALFLEPYETGKSAVGQDLHTLRLLVADNVKQTRRLDEFEAQANARIAASTDIVTSRQNTQKLPTLAQFERGKQLMDVARTTITEMEGEEKRLLEQRTGRTRTVEHFNLSLIGLGSLAGVVFLVVAGATVSREIGISATARAQVISLNADLERRVEQRTAALQSEIAARVEADAKLRASEEMFRMLLDGIKDYAVYMLDAEGRVASWNSGAAGIKGYDAEEIIGKHVSCFYTETDREKDRPQETLREAAQVGRFEGEGWRVRKDSSKFWANFVITPLYESNGALRGYSKVVRDITDRKRAEDELRKQASLLELAHDAILVRDLQSRVVFWNRGAEHLYGQSVEEATGRVTHELLQTKFPIPLADIEAILASKGDWEGELRHTTRHGTEVIVASRWSIQRDEFGAPTAILEINRDITDRKRAEAALSESEGRLAGVIASAMDSIITVDDQQRIVLFNCAAEKMFRCPELEAIGQPITRFIPQRFHGAHAGHIHKFGETGVTNRAMGLKNVLWALRADGQEFQIEASISQAVTGGKKLFTVILRDVTERVQAEEAVRDAQARMTGIIASAMDAIITADEQQHILVFNAAAEKMFRCAASEALGQPVMRFIPQRFHAAHSEHIKKFGENGVTARAMGKLGALWAVRADGEEFQIEASISHVEAAGQKMFTVILRDVTERVRAEAEREHLAAVVESSDDAIISKDLDGTINAWNRGAEKIFGYSTPEAIGKPMLMLFPPERMHEESDILARIRCGESVEHFETIRVRKDGTKIDVSVTISPIRDSNGAIIGASKIARDITERKQTEAALAEQALMFKLVLDNMGEGLIAADREGRFLIWNDAAKNLMGREAADLPSEQWNTHYRVFLPDGITLHPADSLPLVRALRGESVQVELMVEHAEPDSRVWLEVAARPMKDAQGQPCGGVAVLHDITERKHTQEALRESEERFQAMANGIPQLAWMAKADGHIFWYNQRWYDYTGTTFEQMEGWAWQSVHDPEMLPKVLERWNGSIARGEPFDMELPLRGADGRFRIFLTRVMPLQGADGVVTRWFGTNTDISEQKESARQFAEQAQELSRQAVELANSRQALETQTLMLQSVLDSMEEGLVVADEQRKFIIWNPAAARIVGLGGTNVPPQEWGSYYGTYLPDTITPFPNDQNPLVRAIRGEVSSAEMFIRNPKLEQGVWIESNGAPLRDKNGALRGGVVAFRDITQKKAAELEIRKLNESLEERIAKRTEQLETANRELESFTYSVSHDLRAPLRHIMGFAGACLEEFGATLDPQALHYVQRIQDGTRRMGVLTDELLNLARTGQRSLRLQLTALNSVVEEIISMLKAETEGREVEWKISDLPSVECDPVLVRQVFQNLLSNAIKYSRRRPHAVIEIGHTQEKDQQVIFVRDNGAGFNMRYADKLFGVFQRLHREEEFEGTGVGLATVHRIVQKHGGRIWAEAELDHGATFYFTLGGNEVAGSRSDAATAGARS